jgi:uncharacterized protein YndB with AHSA1/START domain
MQSTNVAERGTVRLERVYQVTPELLWEALTDKAQMKKWYFNVDDFRPEKGFQFSFEGTTKTGEIKIHRCVVTEVIPMKRLQHTWEYDGHPGHSVLTWELIPEGSATRVRLIHEGLDSIAQNGPGFQPENFEQGWTYFLDEALPRYLKQD